MVPRRHSNESNQHLKEMTQAFLHRTKGICMNLLINMDVVFVRKLYEKKQKNAEVCHTVYLFPFRVQGVGEDVSVQDLAIRAVDNNAESSIMNCHVRFHAGQVVAVRHNRKRETLSFFLALIKEDILVKQTPGSVDSWINLI